MRTQFILLSSPSGTGKSTLARLLAGRLPRCAFIEVDTLRYMIVRGLVANSGGTPPSEAPEEYQRRHGSVGGHHSPYARDCRR
jgi:adenylate kinase family enzyme